MKKNYFNFFFLLTVFSIGGLLLMIALESAFGIVPVFIVSCILVFICGIVIIPLQIKQMKRKRDLNEYLRNLDKLEKLNKNKFKHKQDLGYYKRHNLP